MRVVALLAAATLAVAACGGRAAHVPPLPPVPHLDMRGPAIARVQHAGVLRVASDLSYPPMEFRDGGTARGFDVDLAALLAGALGVRLEISDIPVAAMGPEFPRDVDLLVSALTAGRAPGIPSDPYFVTGQAVLWRDEAPVRTLEALRDLRVAVTAGTAGEALAGTGGPRVVSYVPEQALAAVADGRAHAALGDRTLVLGFAQTHPHLGVTAGPWQEAPLVAVARPDAPDIAAFVSAAIRELRQNGGLEQLGRRWRF